jgi:hypothetical protein
LNTRQVITAFIFLVLLNCRTNADSNLNQFQIAKYLKGKNKKIPSACLMRWGFLSIKNNLIS